MQLALWIKHPAEANRREQEGELERFAKDRRAQIARAHRDALPRAEGDVAERRDVLAQRDFVFGAAVEGGKDERRNACSRREEELEDGHCKSAGDTSTSGDG